MLFCSFRGNLSPLRRGEVNANGTSPLQLHTLSVATLKQTENTRCADEQELLNLHFRSVCCHCAVCSWLFHIKIYFALSEVLGRNGTTRWRDEWDACPTPPFPNCATCFFFYRMFTLHNLVLNLAYLQLSPKSILKHNYDMYKHAYYRINELVQESR